MDLGSLTDGQSLILSGQSNVGATNDIAERPSCRVDETSGVWYKFNLVFPAEVAVTTCDGANFQTDIAIYRGACDELECQEDFADTSDCSWSALIVDRVDSIYVRVQGIDGGAGSFVLTVSVVALADSFPVSSSLSQS